MSNRQKRWMQVLGGCSLAQVIVTGPDGCRVNVPGNIRVPVVVDPGDDDDDDGDVNFGDDDDGGDCFLADCD